MSNSTPQSSLIAGLFALLLTGASPSVARAQTTADVSAQRALVNRYCVTCHNEKLKTAGLLLDKANLENVAADGELWERVIRKLRGNSMPPPGVPRPDAATLKAFSNHLKSELDRAAAANPNPGRTAVHRLNRAEYANAIRDLLALDPTALDVASLLPADDAGYGFDNIGDVLSISPLLMEAYLSAARKVSLLALGDPAMKPVEHTYEIPKYILQFDRMSEDLPFGSRGGASITHYFPVDGEYELRIGLQKNDDYLIIGLDRERHMDIRLDEARVRTLPVGGEAFREQQMERVKASAGKNQDKRDLDEYYRRTADEVLVLKLPVTAGRHAVGVTFPLITAEREGVWQSDITDYAFARDYGHPDEEPAVGSVTVKGPLQGKGIGQTPSRARILTCQPPAGDVAKQSACARNMFSTLARRAYRRPVSDTDVSALVDIYERRRAQSGFEEAVQAGLQRLLVDPEFLLRIERDPRGATPGSIHRISDLELASRLSFFLWSSIPDDELLDIAAAGKLSNEKVLDAQVRRMLADTKSSALVSNFAGQWLYLRNVKAVWPNPDYFPDFNINLRESFQRETELLFESMLREDRPLLELLSADYTFVNEPLARHYGIDDVYGSQFRRVKIADENRRGLLGQGSILAVTSFATRTAPTIRGKWLLENLMGTPPPPPPPDVPSLQEKKGSDGKPLTMRDQMEAHRANPACASCHRVMDPLGFALDNFDATGKWRDREGNNVIDASGVLPDGTRFKGPAELRKILLSQPDLFLHTAAERMLTYALGRGVEYQDQPAIRKILRDGAGSEMRWSALVSGIVKSVPFQMRRTP
jgi:cytochrome c5